MRALIFLLLPGLCACSGSSPGPDPSVLLDAPQIAVGQAWQELESKSIYAPTPQTINQEKVLSEFNKITNPDGKKPLRLSFASKQDFVLAVKGEQFKDIEKVISSNKSPDEFARWYIYSSWINAVARSFDAQSSFYQPSQQAAVSTMVSAAAEGLGLSLLSKEAGSVVVGAVDEQGPAFTAGIKPGLRILAISEEGGEWRDVQNSSAYEAQSLLRGPTNTRVSLRFEDAAGLIKVMKLQRQRWALDGSRAKLKPVKGGFVLSVPSFYVDVDQHGRWAFSTTKDVAAAVDKVNGNDKIFLDLRGNPGGVLEQAGEVGNLLGIDGVAWKVVSRNSVQEQILKSSTRSLPRAVWVDDKTGSAAEVLAGALQSRGVPVIGVPTFGKTTMQLLVPLDRISMVKAGSSKTGNLLFTTAKITWNQSGSSRLDPDCVIPGGIVSDVDMLYLKTMQSCIVKMEAK